MALFPVRYLSAAAAPPVRVCFGWPPPSACGGRGAKPSGISNPVTEARRGLGAHHGAFPRRARAGGLHRPGSGTVLGTVLAATERAWRREGATNSIGARSWLVCASMGLFPARCPLSLSHFPPARCVLRMAAHGSVLGDLSADGPPTASGISNLVTAGAAWLVCASTGSFPARRPPLLGRFPARVGRN